jgi:alanine-synthesizing transaminase
MTIFSTRYDRHSPPNALGLLLADKKAAGRPVCDLTLSNPTRAGFTYDSESILAALGQPAAMVYEPDARGLPAARQAVARHYDVCCGAGIDPEGIFLTASTSEAYGILAKLLGDPGDEVLIPQPGYPLLSYLMRFEGLRPVAYPLRYHDALGWRFDPELLSALMTPRTRAVVLVNPNNPTGSYVKEDELGALDALCCRHDMALIVDEVFADYAAADAPGNRVRTAAGRTRALCFVLNGFSKMVALPQVKLGWIAAGGDPEAVFEACERLEVLLDFYLSVSSQVQHAAGRLFALRQPIQNQIQARLAQNSCFLHDQAERTSNFGVLRREGGWYAVVDIADAWDDEARAVHLLKTSETLIHPGRFFGFGRQGYVVLSLLPPPELFQAGVGKLVTAFGSLD